MEYLLSIAAAAVLAGVLLKISLRRITLLEYERGLKYVRGRFDSELGPGQYWYLPVFTLIQKLDVRPQFVTIAGQEVLSADGVTLKVSLAANFEIADADIAVNKVQSCHASLYLELQLALREIVGAAEIETVLAGRGELSKKLMEIAAPKAGEIGLRLISVNLKDVMFPGKLKEIFAQVVAAKNEGLAALERARGETAALRNLANAARMLDGNPNLMQLRLVQAMEASTGNTYLLGNPPATLPIPVSRGD